jgi:E3 ubiquitin-protein ligase BRE1
LGQDHAFAVLTGGILDQSATLRSQLTSVVSERARLSDDLEHLTAALRKAERRADRLASPTVRKTERPKEEEENAREAAAEAERQRVAAQEAKQAEEERKPVQLLPNGVAGAAITPADLEAERNAAAQEVSDALAEAMLRLDEGDALRAQLQAAREEAEQLRREIACMPDERMLETPCYRELHTHFMAALEEMERTKRVLEGVEEENTELRTQLIEKSTTAQEEVSGQLEELRSALKAHEADVARLRGQRDDLSAELSERRQRENVKLTQVDEMKALLNAREDRIATLRSEVRRAHMTLAARSGDEAALQRARGAQGEDDVALIEELQSRLK